MVNSKHVNAAVWDVPYFTIYGVINCNISSEVSDRVQNDYIDVIMDGIWDATYHQLLMITVHG